MAENLAAKGELSARAPGAEHLAAGRVCSGRRRRRGSGGVRLALASAAEVPEAAAAAVFIQRLFTSYLPPIWDWFTLVWMRRRNSL